MEYFKQKVYVNICNVEANVAVLKKVVLNEEYELSE